MQVEWLPDVAAKRAVESVYRAVRAMCLCEPELTTAEKKTLTDVARSVRLWAEVRCWAEAADAVRALDATIEDHGESLRSGPAVRAVLTEAHRTLERRG